MMDYSLPDLISVCTTEEVVRREMEGHIERDCTRKHWMLKKVTPEKLREIISTDYYFEEIQIID